MATAVIPGRKHRKETHRLPVTAATPWLEQGRKKLSTAWGEYIADAQCRDSFV